jgi:pilus assembly protein FimV
MLSGKTRLTIAILALAVGGPVAALGFGEMRAQAFLGQPLNLAVPVTLAEGESLGAECASAEVLSGEVRLQPGMVRVRVTQGRDEREAILRISSTVAIDEPVVNITIAAGCPTRITRSMVLLADPPLVSTAQAPAVEAAPAVPAPAAAPARVRPPEAGSTSAPAPGAAAPAGNRIARPAVPRRSPSVAPSASAKAPTVAPRSSPAPTRSAKAEPARRTEGRPRLQLDAGLPSAGDTAVLAAEAQASAARLATATAEAAASAAQARMTEMEAELARMRADSKAQTDALVQLRQQLALDQAQRQRQAWLIPALLAAVAVLALFALWLAWRLRQQSAVPQRQQWWDKSGAAELASVLPDGDSGYRTSTFKSSTAAAPAKLPSAPAPLSSAEISAPAPLEALISPPTVAAPMAVTIPPLSKQEEESRRAVSVDEQIDLEQQADFFIALGHDESAIDLLMAHLRSTGGGTPLPFLKLLEIHRRRADREAYERTRVRFNQRFNSVAPEWQADPRAGRALDAYPLVVGRIQHAWPKPLDAMAELESLLFRRGAGAEMFDLPAYQEVLFLYQLARDLHSAEQPDKGADVDVLLPIGTVAAPVAEGTIVLRPEFNDGQAVTLDLDLTTKSGAVETFESVPDAELDLDLDPGQTKAKDADDDLWSADPDARRRE